jgi:hypothetical protein
MSATARLVLSIVILPAFLSSSFTQQYANLPPRGRSMVVNVLDAHGNAIRNLTKENFRVRLNGKPVAVINAQYSLAPRRIVVLLDISGSMTGEERMEKWQIARDAVDDMLVHTPRDGSIAMLTFASKVQDVFDFTQGRTAIAKWLRESASQRPNLKRPARTALFDTILKAVKLMGAIQPGDAIYAITDGGENASQTSAAQTEAALLKSGVRLFALLFSEPLPAPDEHEGKDSFLKMVEDSGGFAFGLAGHQRPFAASWDFEYAYDKNNREKITAYTKWLNIQVNGFWTLDLAAPLTNKDSKMKLEVIGYEGRIGKDVGITYTRMLPAAR